MPYNLLVEPIAPFRMKSGAVRWLPVRDLADGLPDGDYAVEPDWPRADFNIATYELLIGILSVAMPPRSHDDWRARWKTPPSGGEIVAALEPLKPAFDLDGDGPLFMQERDIGGDGNPIEALLIDTPGANGQKKNADLLTHRGRYPALCLPAAAMALYALQAFAPSGGAGNRTSMRGGGPLTALIIPAGDDPAHPVPLWRKLWANVGVRDAPPSTLEKVFVWLAPARSAGKEAGDAQIHDSDPGLDPLHAFFGVPRRIRLVFANEPKTCAMTGIVGRAATGFAQKPYGMNYGNWSHPLTPYRREKEASEPYSMKPKAGRFGYRDWVSVVAGDGGDKPLRMIPANVREAKSARRATLRARETVADARIRVGGWAMNNMEAISYLIAEQPLHLAPVDDADLLDDLARRLAEAGDEMNRALRGAVANALYSGKVAADKGVLERLRVDFYERTDDEFHDLLDEALRRAPGIDRRTACERWLELMRRTALDLFDEAAPVLLEDAEKAGQVVKARGWLAAVSFGHGKSGGALFKTLELPPPEKRATVKEEEPA